MTNFFECIPVIAHTLIGFYFAFFGFWNIYHWRPTMEIMAQKNIPHPWLILAIGIAWQTIAGFLIILGFFIKIAALSLIPFTIISLLIFHPFWNMEGPQRTLNFLIFIANMTLGLGGLLLLLNHLSPLTQFSDLLR